MSDTRLQAGFEDVVHDAQRCFRAVLSAMAHPGMIEAVPAPAGMPAPLTPAMTAVLLTLADYDTPLWLDQVYDTDAVRHYLAFHCGCPLTLQPGPARFIAVSGVAALPPLGELAPGTAEYPDRSVTVLLELPSFAAGGARVRLSGPGIRGLHEFSMGALDAAFWQEAQRNAWQYPLGVDFIFCAGGSVMALPRSTRIELVDAASEG